MVADAIEQKVQTGVLQPASSELAPYSEWRINSLLTKFLDQHRHGTWADALMSRAKRRAYWNYEWPPYINNEKLVASLTPPVRPGIVEWVGIAFTGKPGVGKTTKMSWLAAILRQYYRHRGCKTSIHYTNRLVDAVKYLDDNPVQILVIDDASLFQHSRLSMTRENIQVIQLQDMIRHEFEKKVSFTGVIIMIWGIQRWMSLDVGIRDLNRCAVHSGITSKDDYDSFSGPARSFLNEQERAFERHDLTARLYGLVTGLSGEPFIIRTDHEIAKATFNEIFADFRALQREREAQEGKKAEEDGAEVLRRLLPRSTVRRLGGDSYPDIEIIHPSGARDYVNSKHYDFANKTGLYVASRDCVMEIEAAKAAGRESFYIYVLDKDSGMKGFFEVPLGARGRYVRKGELADAARVPADLTKAMNERSKGP